MSDGEAAPFPLVGIFVGGESRRMGRPKGLLPAPGKTNVNLIGRLRLEVETALPGAPCVLVGERPEYGSIDLPVVTDEVVGKGPLGGITGLLSECVSRGVHTALVLACDLPYLNAALIRRLALEPCDQAVCPVVDERFQPLFALYHVRFLDKMRRALLRGDLALQPLLREASTRVLSLSNDEASLLRDWDTPEDITN